LRGNSSLFHLFRLRALQHQAYLIFKGPNGKRRTSGNAGHHP
jgi:hypothetical protein